VTRSLLLNGRQLFAGGVPLAWAAHPELANMGVAWTHSWDAADATFYTPSAGEQAEFGITATQRVQTIADGSGSKPLTRDTTSYGTGFGTTLPLPGPQFIAHSSRFRRPAVRFDEMSADPLLHAMLSPQITLGDAGDYFNTPGGYTPPYWCALLCRLDTVPGGAMDSVLGSDRTISATATVSFGNQLLTGTDWSVACWYDPLADDPTGFIPDGVVRSGHTQSADESVLLIPSMAEGTDASAMHVYWRDAAGAVQSDVGIGTLSVAAPSMAWRDLFFGWIDEHSYLSAAAIKDGPLTDADLAAVVAWAEPWLVPVGAQPSEP
jgi:hypothetical protein